jgi:hypothetical protein
MLIASLLTVRICSITYSSHASRKPSLVAKWWTISPGEPPASSATDLTVVPLNPSRGNLSRAALRMRAIAVRSASRGLYTCSVSYTHVQGGASSERMEEVWTSVDRASRLLWVDLVPVVGRQPLTLRIRQTLSGAHFRRPAVPTNEGRQISRCSTRAVLL